MSQNWLYPYADSTCACRYSSHSRSRVTAGFFSSWWTHGRSGATRPPPGGSVGNSRASSALSSSSGGSGQSMPACAARLRYSDTVPAPMPQAAATARWLSPFSWRSRRISLIFLIGSLSIQVPFPWAKDLD